MGSAASHCEASNVVVSAMERWYLLRVERAKPRFEAAVEETLDYLASASAIASLEVDPYWPKWASPWWRVTLLFELGRVSDIPRSFLRHFFERVRRHYLPSFPFRECDVPEGADSIGNVACHCALGTVFRIAAAAGFDPDDELPFARAWFLRYQLPDGGWNCDESAYLKPTPKSSVVSSLPVLEALLEGTSRPFTSEERAVLAAGARYLVERQFVRSRTGDRRILNPAWLIPCFPRFYEYDALRGLAFVARWHERTGHAWSGEAAEEVVRVLPADDTSERAMRRIWDGTRTRERGPDGGWTKREADTFPLLVAMGDPGVPRGRLADDLAVVRRALAAPSR